MLLFYSQRVLAKIDVGRTITRMLGLMPLCRCRRGASSGIVQVDAPVPVPLFPLWGMACSKA